MKNSYRPHRVVVFALFVLFYHQDACLASQSAYAVPPTQTPVAAAAAGCSSNEQATVDLYGYDPLDDFDDLNINGDDYTTDDDATSASSASTVTENSKSPFPRSENMSIPGSSCPSSQNSSPDASPALAGRVHRSPSNSDLKSSMPNTTFLRAYQSSVKQSILNQGTIPLHYCVQNIKTLGNLLIECSSSQSQKSQSLTQIFDTLENINLFLIGRKGKIGFYEVLLQTLELEASEATAWAKKVIEQLDAIDKRGQLDIKTKSSLVTTLKGFVRFLTPSRKTRRGRSDSF